MLNNLSSNYERDHACVIAPLQHDNPMPCLLPLLMRVALTLKNLIIFHSWHLIPRNVPDPFASTAASAHCSDRCALGLLPSLGYHLFQIYATPLQPRAFVRSVFVQRHPRFIMTVYPSNPPKNPVVEREPSFGKVFSAFRAKDWQHVALATGLSMPFGWWAGT